MHVLLHLRSFIDFFTTNVYLAAKVCMHDACTSDQEITLDRQSKVLWPLKIDKWGRGGLIFIYLSSQTVKTIDVKKLIVGLISLPAARRRTVKLKTSSLFNIDQSRSWLHVAFVNPQCFPHG